MGYRFSSRSLARLQECHQDLVLLMTEALTDPDCPMDFTILEGHRNQERQDKMVEEGRSFLPWPRSKHNTWPSHAVDIAPWVDGTVSWSWDHFNPLADHIRSTWNRLSQDGKTTGQYTLTWGGTWTTLKDGPHFQIDPV